MPVTPDIIARVQMKDRAKLASYIWAIVRDEHIVEDVLQDVYALAITKSQQIENEAHLLNWMRRAGRLMALRVLRNRSRDPVCLSKTTLNMLESEWQRYDDQEPKEMITALRQCLNLLTPHAKKLIAMRYADGKTSGQIAEALGRKVQSIYVALSRVHHILGVCLRSRIAMLKDTR